MPKNKRAAIYARVSTLNGQTPDNQLHELRIVAERQGWVVVEEFVDDGFSGAKGRGQRPAYKRLCQAATRKQFDVVMAWSVDRLGRSLQELVAFLGDIQAKDIDLYIHQQGVDTTTPSGKAMFAMLGVFAEFERALISERVKSGLERARSEGKRLGRPRASEEVKLQILALRIKGMGINSIARHLGVGNALVQKTCTGLTQ